MTHFSARSVSATHGSHRALPLATGTNRGHVSSHACIEGLLVLVVFRLRSFRRFGCGRPLFRPLHIRAPLDDEPALDTLGRDRDLAGVVLVNAHARLLGQIARRLPGRVVSIGVGSTDVPLVDVDTHDSSVALLTHVLAAGHRRVALVAGPTRISCTSRQREVYTEMMDAGGLPTRIVPAPFTRAGGRTAAESLLRRWPDTDAVIASCDEAALGVIEALTRHGRRVPDDVAVTGFDDLPLAEYAGLTSATHPVEQIAAVAVRRVLTRSGPLEQWFAAEPVLRRTA